MGKEEDDYSHLQTWVCTYKVPREVTREILNSSKVTRYKVSIEKSVAFLYINNETAKKEENPIYSTPQKIPKTQN